jgi:DNA-binding transcriptional regulator YiaG
MDAMNKDSRTESFGRQMAHAMGELRSIMSRGQSPSANGRLTARTIEVAEPSAYNARRIKQTRAMLNVSQTVFARIVGVSDVLVRSWERGVRQPAPIARRLLDQIRRYPAQFSPLVHPSSRKVSTAARARAAHIKRSGRKAA